MQQIGRKPPPWLNRHARRRRRPLRHGSASQGWRPNTPLPSERTARSRCGRGPSSESWRESKAGAQFGCMYIASTVVGVAEKVRQRKGPRVLFSKSRLRSSDVCNIDPRLLWLRTGLRTGRRTIPAGTKDTSERNYDSTAMVYLESDAGRGGETRVPFFYPFCALHQGLTCPPLFFFLFFPLFPVKPTVVDADVGRIFT